MTALVRPGLAAFFVLALWVVWTNNVMQRPGAINEEQRQISHALLTMLDDLGAVIVPFTAKPGTMLQKVVKFRLPDCGDPLVVVPLRIGQTNENILHALVAESGVKYDAYSIYRGQTIKGYGFVRFQIQSLFVEIGQVFGSTNNRFARQALMLMIPQTCATITPPDWQAFWLSTELDAKPANG